MKRTLNTANEIYLTTDMALAAAMSLFHPIRKIDRSNPRKATFTFQRSDDFDSLLESYWSGELKVVPLEFFNQIRNIKARLYE